MYGISRWVYLAVVVAAAAVAAGGGSASVDINANSGSRDVLLASPVRIEKHPSMVQLVLILCLDKSSGNTSLLQ